MHSAAEELHLPSRLQLGTLKKISLFTLESHNIDKNESQVKALGCFYFLPILMLAGLGVLLIFPWKWKQKRFRRMSGIR